MSFGDENPTFEELMEVVQRQQEVIEIFEQRVAACQVESEKLAEEGQKKTEIIEILENREQLLRTELDALKVENQRLMEREIGEKEDQLTESELETVGELRMKCKEMSYELERLSTRQNTLEVELETEKRNHSLARSKLEEERRQRTEERKKLTTTVENMEKTIREARREHQESLSRQEIEMSKLKTELEIKEQREKQLERHYEDMMNEMTEIRKEKSTAIARKTEMAAENAELKTKLQQLRARLPRNEHDIDDMNKLLADQSHLIAALREEAKLLARKVEGDAREYRLLLALSLVQIITLAVTFAVCEQSTDVNVSHTVNFVLLVHLGVSMAMASMTMIWRSVTPNMIGLSLYTFAGSLSLWLISQNHEELNDGQLATWSVGLTTLGFCCFATCWWKVYREKFCDKR